MNVVYLYFVNKLFLAGRYWDFNNFDITDNRHIKTGISEYLTYNSLQGI